MYVSRADTCSLKLVADENLLQYIIVTQQGNKIIVREKDGFHLQSSDTLRVYVTAPVYNEIDAAGASNIIGLNKIDNSENLGLQISGAGYLRMETNAPQLTAGVSGSGDINLKGQAKSFNLNFDGAGTAHCFELLAENVKVDINGAGTAEVYASVLLDAQVSGACTVNYKGNPGTVNKHITGIGTVNKVN